MSNNDEVLKIISEISAYDDKDENFYEKCACLATEITHKKTSIHDVVENLAGLLVNSSSEKRERGTLVLSLVLKNLSASQLSSTELHFISSFYADRLKDHHQVIPAVLKGILWLSKSDNLPNSEVNKLLTAIFENIPCQQQQFEDRKCIYMIFKELFIRKLSEIQSMGLNYVLGVISAIDSERDSRNLIFLFHWLRELMPVISLGHLQEDMFDVISCYFPIDFRSSSQELQEITRKDLATALCSCLCSVPEFAEYCIPLALEKLNSSLQIAKLDAIHILIESCSVFDSKIYEQHHLEIFSLLHKEIFDSNDSDIIQASLTAITKILRNLSNDDIFKQIIKQMFDAVKMHFKPDTKLFLSSVKILLAIAEATLSSSDAILNLTYPLLINQYNITQNPSHKEIIFKSLLNIVLVYVNVHNIDDIMSVELLKEIPTLCLKTILSDDPDLEVTGLNYISLLVNKIPQNARNSLFEILKSQLITVTEPNIRTSLLNCLKIFAEIHPNEVFKHFCNEVDINNETILEHYLETLNAIMHFKTFTDFVLVKYIEYCTSENLNTSKVSVKSLRIFLQNTTNKSIVLELQENYQIIDKLINWVIEILNTENQILLVDVATIVKLVIVEMNCDIQRTIVENHLDKILAIYCSNCNQLVILIEGLLTNLRTEVNIHNKYNLMKELVQTYSTMEFHKYLFVCRLVGNIINKSSEDEDLCKLLTEFEPVIDDAGDDENLKNKITLTVWITKALVMKGSDQANTWTDKLIMLLDKHEDVATGLQIIMDDQCDCLNTKSFCVVRILYRQKFFTYVTDKLSVNYNCINPNYLKAMGFLLISTPQQVIIMYFKKIFRLLILCLECCKDSNTLCAVLNTLCMFITSKESFLEDHVDELLSRFLPLTLFESSLKVRISALKCIHEMCIGYPIYKLLPHKKTVTLGLAKCLDDKKRLVRQQAVETSMRWYLLDAPT